MGEFVEEIPNSPHDVVWQDGDWFECVYCSSKATTKESFRRMDCTFDREEGAK